MEVILSNQSISPLKDLKVLDNVRRLFYETTNLGLSFYYPCSNTYDFYPSTEKTFTAGSYSHIWAGALHEN